LRSDGICQRRLAVSGNAAPYTLQVTGPSVGTPFHPFGAGGLRTVNAIEFAPDGSMMITTLFVAEVAKTQGLTPVAGAPEIALYESGRDGAGWSAPA